MTKTFNCLLLKKKKIKLSFRKKQRKNQQIKRISKRKTRKKK